VKIVAPPNDEYENYIVSLKEQSPVKKTLKTASKSAYKRQRNAFIIIIIIIIHAKIKVTPSQ